MNASSRPSSKRQPPAARRRDAAAGPYLLVVTAQGMTLRTPLAPFRTASNKLGRRFVKLNDGDKVVIAAVLKDEKSIFLASQTGHVIHFPIDADQHPFRRRQGGDRHQAGRRRRVHRRRP